MIILVFNPSLIPVTIQLPVVKTVMLLVLNRSWILVYCGQNCDITSIQPQLDTSSLW